MDEQVTEKMCDDSDPALVLWKKDLGGKLRFLDSLVAMGEEPWEIRFYVKQAIDLACPLYFGCLARQGVTEGSEILTQMVEDYFEFIYLGHEGRNRRPTLAKVSKAKLEQFLQLVDFAIPQELWDLGIDPFAGLERFYVLLEEVGYPAELSRRRKALAELKKSMKKRPVSTPQGGYEMEH